MIKYGRMTMTAMLLAGVITIMPGAVMAQQGSGRTTTAEQAVINPQAFDHNLMSQLVFECTNAERVRAGLRPFQNNQYLCAAATAHSQDMAQRGYFSHKSKGIFNRTDPTKRISSTGYQPRMTAENIAMIPTYNRQVIRNYPGYGPQVIDADRNTYHGLAQRAVREWMDSPGHRRNIMNGSLRELGVGTWVGMKNNVPYVYLTQNFGG